MITALFVNRVTENVLIMRRIICLHGQLTTCKISPVDDRPDERLPLVYSF